MVELVVQAATGYVPLGLDQLQPVPIGPVAAAVMGELQEVAVGAQFLRLVVSIPEFPLRLLGVPGQQQGAVLELDPDADAVVVLLVGRIRRRLGSTVGTTEPSVILRGFSRDRMFWIPSSRMTCSNLRNVGVVTSEPESRKTLGLNRLTTSVMPP